MKVFVIVCLLTVCYAQTGPIDQIADHFKTACGGFKRVREYIPLTISDLVNLFGKLCTLCKTYAADSKCCWTCLAAAVPVFFVLGGRIVAGKGRVSLYFPSVLYWFGPLVISPMNLLITILASRTLSHFQPDWTLNPLLAPGKFGKASPGELDQLKTKIRKRSYEAFDEKVLMQLFDSLPGANPHEMLCNWRGTIVHRRGGGILDSANYVIRVLQLFGLGWGKRYRSTYVGDPIVIHCLWGRFFWPLPLWGNVSLPAIQYRGTVNATMVYDNQPWQDHFRVLDDGKVSGRRMLLGNWHSHEKVGGWFTLEAMPELDAATAGTHVLNAPPSYKTA